MGRRERAQLEACSSLPCRHGRQRRTSAIVRVPGRGGKQASRPAIAVGEQRASPSQAAAAATAARAMTTTAASHGEHSRP
eukprot:scaffold70461_cov68-Phaeocystis_antarctica.AAC.2